MTEQNVSRDYAAVFMVTIYRMLPIISVNLFAVASVRKFVFTNFHCCVSHLLLTDAV